ncbi:MAG TPA: FMN-binding glutamate synthase family protein, partial [Vicinamibacterales bacterium]|nr:FMN-binding glutamate synthase family protein [Vicinamibacterales bacterium]
MTVALIAVGYLALALAVLAVHDLTQRRHAVTRNFPVVGHLRYLLESMGEPLRQYFFAGDLDERPYNRVTRSWVYASAKGENNLVGFGSQADQHQPGRLLILPSMYPTRTAAALTDADLPRPRLIGATRRQPYQPRRFANIAGMSFGALSANAVRALSRGAGMAGCYLGTGEGSLSPYHLDGDGDILYQIGPAKFGCRTADGRFDDDKAAAILALPQVKMVEIKLGQGAKPGKGGVLPKEKITSEIAAIRGIPIGVDCHSPNGFDEFDDAPSLLDFIARVRRITDKPVGLKMVVGSTAEIDELC